MIIKTTELKRSFEVGSETVEAIKGINLEVQAGEFLAITGPSGSGKTTLMNIIGCLDTPTSGEYFLNNKLVNELNENELAGIRNKEIGFVFQFHNLLSEFTALENICLPALILGKSRKESEIKALSILKILRLSNRAHHKPNQLSGGEQQRVAVARALINSPSIVLADEPSGNLDSKNADQLHNLFLKLNKDLGQTFVVITHNKKLASLATRKLEMKDGMII